MPREDTRAAFEQHFGEGPEHHFGSVTVGLEIPADGHWS
jgi:hypothetical protein